MIEVHEHYWVALILAAIFGAAGGAISSALPSARDPEHELQDIGAGVRIVVGAFAAMAFLYFLPPSDVVDTEGALVRREYDPFKLVPASIVVGSAGLLFMSAMQERLLRTVSDTKIAAARAVLESAASTPATAGSALTGSTGSSATDVRNAALAALNADVPVSKRSRRKAER